MNHGALVTLLLAVLFLEVSAIITGLLIGWLA